MESSVVVCDNCGKEADYPGPFLPPGWWERKELIPMNRQQRRLAERKGEPTSTFFYACSQQCAIDADAKAGREHALYPGPQEM